MVNVEISLETIIGIIFIIWFILCIQLVISHMLYKSALKDKEYWYNKTRKKHKEVVEMVDKYMYWKNEYKRLKKKHGKKGD